MQREALRGGLSDVGRFARVNKKPIIEDGDVRRGDWAAAGVATAAPAPACTRYRTATPAARIPVRATAVPTAPDARCGSAEPIPRPVPCWRQRASPSFFRVVRKGWRKSIALKCRAGAEYSIKKDGRDGGWLATDRPPASGLLLTEERSCGFCRGGQPRQRSAQFSRLGHRPTVRIVMPAVAPGVARHSRERESGPAAAARTSTTAG